MAFVFLRESPFLYNNIYRKFNPHREYNICNQHNDTKIESRLLNYQIVNLDNRCILLYKIILLLSLLITPCNTFCIVIFHQEGGDVG